MKTAYKFESKHLGKAFMKELEEIGYSLTFDRSPKPSNCIITDNKSNFYYTDFASSIVSEIFQLETDWNEALSHARRQLDPEFKVGDWMKVITHNYTWLIHITKIENGFYKGFGFKDGVWYDFEPEARIFKGYDDYTYINPTPEEIKSALVKEANRMGISS